MNNKQIIFTEKNTAKLLDSEYRLPSSNEVVVETAFSTVSCGTERANITGIVNPFPINYLGYSSTGTVIEKGDKVESVNIGDRVVVFWGTHSKYNTVNEENVVKIEDDSLSLSEAAISFICTFSLAAIRKTRLEIGESAIVVGLGLLGQIAIKLLRLGGATPIIALDPVKERRDEALSNGADFALDPTEDGFAQKVKELTCGGANVAIEITGVGEGLDTALDCMARFGRVALLGCTRDKNFTIDYYNKVHWPGISLIGAHTRARPDAESHPGYFTHRDDINVALKLISGKRLDVSNLIKKIYSPKDCSEVYTQLVNDKNFPITVQFDWSKLNEKD